MTKHSKPTRKKQRETWESYNNSEKVKNVMKTASRTHKRAKIKMVIVNAYLFCRILERSEGKKERDREKNKERWGDYSKTQIAETPMLAAAAQKEGSDMHCIAFPHQDLIFHLCL